jgi:hypothetical protein
LCTKKQIFKTKKQDKDSRGNGAPPSQFSSLSPPATVKKKKRARVDFQRFHPGYGGWNQGWGNREGLLFAGEDGLTQFGDFQVP